MSLSKLMKQSTGNNARFVKMFGKAKLIRFIARKSLAQFKLHLPFVENPYQWLSNRIDIKKFIQKYEAEFSELPLQEFKKNELLSLLDAFLHCAVDEMIEAALDGKPELG